MPFRAAFAFTLPLLAAYGAPQASAATAAVVAEPNPDAWTIGPVIQGRNRSSGVPLHPLRGRNGSWYIDLPRAGGSVNYVTFPHGSLAGKSRIRMRYRIEAEPGARILPKSAPNFPAILTLYFQRRGDNWTGQRRFETYRWYATFASHTPLQPGEREIVAPLSGNWTAIGTSSAQGNPAAFREAMANADQVGFVLGGGDSYGHGVFATGRARLIVTDFRVE